MSATMTELRPFVISSTPSFWEDWKVLDAGPGLPVAPTFRIEVAPVHDGASWISGETFRRRALLAGAMSGLAARDILLANSVRIPAEYRTKVLVFAGALLGGPNGALCLPCARHILGKWEEHARDVDVGFLGDGVAVRLVPCG